MRRSYRPMGAADLDPPPLAHGSRSSKPFADAISETFAAETTKRTSCKTVGLTCLERS